MRARGARGWQDLTATLQHALRVPDDLVDLVLHEVAPSLVLAVGDEAGRGLRVRLLVRHVRVVGDLNAEALVTAAALLEHVECELHPALEGDELEQPRRSYISPKYLTSYAHDACYYAYYA